MPLGADHNNLNILPLRLQNISISEFKDLIFQLLRLLPLYLVSKDKEVRTNIFIHLREWLSAKHLLVRFVEGVDHIFGSANNEGNIVPLETQFVLQL